MRPSTAIRTWRQLPPSALTQQALARALRQSTSTIMRWEAGRTEPRISEVLKMEAMRPGLWDLLKKNGKRR